MDFAPSKLYSMSKKFDVVYCFKINYRPVCGNLSSSSLCSSSPHYQLTNRNSNSPNDTSVWTKPLFHTLTRPIEGQILDLRSNITKEVGATLVALASAARDAAGPFFLSIQPSIFLTLNSGNKVICGHLDDAMMEVRFGDVASIVFILLKSMTQFLFHFPPHTQVLTYSRTRKGLAGMIKELSETKSPQLRAILAKHLVVILNNWGGKYLTKDTMMIVKATEGCLNDGNMTVRATGREAYGVLQVHTS